MAGPVKNVLIGQIILSDQDLLQGKNSMVQIIGIKDFKLQYHFHVMAHHQCLCHGDLHQLILLLVRHGGGVDHGCLLLR